MLLIALIWLYYCLSNKFSAWYPLITHTCYWNCFLSWYICLYWSAVCNLFFTYPILVTCKSNKYFVIGLTSYYITLSELYSSLSFLFCLQKYLLTVNLALLNLFFLTVLQIDINSSWVLLLVQLFPLQLTASF